MAWGFRLYLAKEAAGLGVLLDRPQYQRRDLGVRRGELDERGGDLQPEGDALLGVGLPVPFPSRRALQAAQRCPQPLRQAAHVAEIICKREQEHTRVLAPHPMGSAALQLGGKQYGKDGQRGLPMKEAATGGERLHPAHQTLEVL